MTNILTKSPTAILIHIPKTGGTSLRSLFDMDRAPRAFGHIPVNWPDAPKIAVIRHPRTRFLSAIKNLKFGNPGLADHFQTPRFPDLTVTRALDILEDGSIGYDRTARDTVSVLKHLAWPQTHPFNCLALADHILRFETLADDVEALRPVLGLTRPLPHLRASGGTEEDLPFTETDEARFRHFFAEDFRQLGYETEPPGPPLLAPHPQRTIWAAWPGLFNGRRIPAEKAATALPDADTDLALFLEQAVPGPTGGTWASRKPNLREHFLELQPEFAGTSRLAHLLACTIATIRRSDGAAGLELFFRIADEHGPRMIDEINTRWLVAVCDTFADHGRTPHQRAIGLAASLLMNSVKLFETERRQYYPKRPWPPQSRFPDQSHIFDGLLAYWTKKGDMVDNMRARVADIAALDPVAGPFLVEMMRRTEANDTSFNRLARLIGDDPRPSTPKWVVRVFEALGRRYL